MVAVVRQLTPEQEEQAIKRHCCDRRSPDQVQRHFLFSECPIGDFTLKILSNPHVRRLVIFPAPIFFVPVASSPLPGGCVSSCVDGGVSSFVDGGVSSFVGGNISLFQAPSSSLKENRRKASLISPESEIEALGGCEESNPEILSNQLAKLSERLKRESQKYATVSVDAMLEALQRSNEQKDKFIGDT